jgi:hypothetical protein
MGIMRLTEIIACISSKTIPTEEQVFHIDISHPATRKEIKKLRAEAKKLTK